MREFTTLGFIAEEAGALPMPRRRRRAALADFRRRAVGAFSLCVREPEIVLFALLQWLVIGLAYVLGVLAASWVGGEAMTGQATATRFDRLMVDLSVILCIGLATLPLGVLSGCMGAAHMLHRQGHPSTMARCLAIVAPNARNLWVLHWIDGVITVKRIMERVPTRRSRNFAGEAAAEAAYNAWKLGIAGMLPGLLLGHSLVDSGRRSLEFLKENAAAVILLRYGYSTMCWLVAIIGYAIAFTLYPRGPEPASMPSGGFEALFLWLAAPLVATMATVVLVLRPVYVLAMCDLYADHFERKGERVRLPREPSPALANWVVVIFVLIVIGCTVVLGSLLGWSP